MGLALPRRKLLISFLPLAVCCTAAADDTALRVSSGAVQPMDEHPTVRMESCRIEGDIAREQTQVRCEFVFVNDGPATTVTMGFPAFRGYGDGVSPKATPALTGFRSWVDGKVVSTRIIERSKKPDQRPDRWYVKPVRFASGQRRVVRDEYLQPNGEISSGMRFFPYALQTGASWHGPIGQVEFVLRWTEPYEWRLYWGREGPGSRHVSDDGRTVSWTLKDLEPEDDISLHFIPWSGYLYCDGLALGPFRLSGTDVWTQVRSLAKILGAAVAYDHRSKTASIATRADNGIQVTAGKPTARVDGQAFALAGAPYIEDGTRLWLPVDAILEHLDHSFEINRDERRFDVSTGAPVVWEAECRSTMVGDDRHVRRPIRLTRVDDVLVGEIRPVMRLVPEARDMLPEPHAAGSRPGIRIRLNSHDLSFWWYTARARVDGKPYALPVAPYITLEGKGMGPLEAICAALDLQCAYNEQEKLLTISAAEGG